MKITTARRRALAVLAYGEQHERQVYEALSTTEPQQLRYASRLDVFWQTASWLVDEGHVAVTHDADGRAVLTLTETGRLLAAAAVA